MSPNGTKRTSLLAPELSAFDFKADITDPFRHPYLNRYDAPS
jgi:hypothetical protein